MSVSSIVTKKIKQAEDVAKEFSRHRGTLCFQKPASNCSKYTWARRQPFIPPRTGMKAVGVARSPRAGLRGSHTLLQCSAGYCF